MICLELFLSFLQIGLFSIGGGHAALPLIQRQVTQVHSWLTMTEFADILTISEMTPGPIAINSATFVGIQVAGPPGAVAATLGCIFPSFIIVMLLARIYYRYRGLSAVQGVLCALKPAVVAMIASAAITLTKLALFPSFENNPGLSSVSPIAVFIFLTAFFVLRKWKISPIYVMAGAGAAGIILYSIF